MNDKSFSNCKISNPIIYPNIQTVSFNGFAWSDMGMVHEPVPNEQQSWQEWLGTQQ